MVSAGRKKGREAWQAKGHVIILVDEKIQTGLFTAKDDDRRQN